MRDRANRDLYVDELGGVSCTRHADAHHDVWSLLTACLAQPPALRELVKIVHALHKDSRPMLHLQALVEHLFPPALIEPDERTELLTLLADVDQRLLGVAYRHASPPAWWRASLDWGDVDSLVRHLETCTTAAGGLHPLLSFVDCVVHQLDTGRLSGHRWLDQVGLRLGIPEELMARLCRSSTVWLANVTETCHVVVELQPDRIDSSRFLLSVSVQHHRFPSQPLHRDDMPRTVREIPAVLAELLREIGADDVTVEFIVPRGLLGHPIDQWLISDEFPHRIGTEYSVVVRSRDRMERRNLHGNWRRKWRWLTENVHEPTQKAMSWVRAVDEPETLYSTLLVDDVPVAVAFAFPPDDRAELGFDALTAALWAGIPVMLWTRDVALVERFEEHVNSVLAGRGLVELPDQVLRLRRQLSPATSDPVLGEHVTLLWDDADRIPESFTRSARLRAPR